MATIITKNSATAGNTPSNLTQGELAINVTDGNLYYGSGSGNVVKQFNTIPTASYALYAVSASYEINTETSSSYADTASYLNPGTYFITASWATNASNAAAIDIYSFSSPVESYLLMSNVVATTGVAVGGDADLRYNSSTNKLTVGSVSATSFTGSLIGTASWATNAITANTASYILNAVSSSFAISSSLASTAQAALSADTAKTVLTVVNATNADFYPTFVDSNNSPTAASENVYTSNRITFNPSTQLLTVPRISSTAITASAFTGSLTGALLGTASWATNAISASWAPSVASNPFPYTGSAIISGSLTITGSLRVGVPGVNNPAIDTTAGTLSRGTQTKVDWINAYLYDSDGTVTVDWENGLFNDQGGNSSIDANTRALYDSAGTTAFDWESRRMIDVAGARSADFDTRFLIYPNGTTTAINYGTQDQVTLNANTIITGSLAIGTSSLGTTENTLVVGLPSAASPGGSEGGQILLQAPGGTYTTASMIDNYQNKLRFLRGTNASSDAYKMQIDMHSGQVQISNYNSKTAFTGSAVATLGADSGGTLITISPILSIQDVTDGTAVTGTTSGTLTKSILIPANTVGVGDVLYIKARARKTGTAGTLVVRMYINTSAAIGGSLIATSATNAATTVYHQYARTAVVKTTTNTETMAGNFNVNADDNIVSSATVSANNIDWTVNQYLVIAHTNASAADSSVNSFGHIQINKA